jgi:hypothetical protein
MLPYALTVQTARAFLLSGTFLLSGNGLLGISFQMERPVKQWYGRIRIFSV